MIVSVVFKRLKAAGHPVHVAEQPHTSAPSLPACVVTLPDSRRLSSLDGPVNTQHGTVRVACMAKTLHAADRLATQVTDTLAGHSGAETFDAGGGQVQTVTVKYLHHDDTRELPSEHRDGEGRIATHGFAVDFRFALDTTFPVTTPA